MSTENLFPNLPPLPAYPAAAGPERDEWHRLARLHMDAACVASQVALAAANRACEAAQRDLIKAIADMPPSGALSFDQLLQLADKLKEFVNGDAKPQA